MFLINDYEIVTVWTSLQKIGHIVGTWRNGGFRNVIHAVITGPIQAGHNRVAGQQWDYAVISPQSV